jgi:hypothetical protein
MFGGRRYDGVSPAINYGVTDTDRHRLYHTCQPLLQNERVVGCFVQARAKQKTDDSLESNWRRDPHSMTNAELFRARMELEERIKRQAALNETARQELQVLGLAGRTLEWDCGCMFVQLEVEENKDD